MSYNTNKHVQDNSYEFLFPEKIVNEYLGFTAKSSYASNFAFYDWEELDKNIKEHFGEPINCFEHKSYIIKEKKMVIDEKCYLFSDKALFLKNQIFERTYYTDELFEADYEKLTMDNKFKVKLNLFAKEPSIENENKFISLMSKEDKIKRKSSEISILCHNQMEGFYLKNVKTIKSKISIEDNYNDDFKEVSKYIIHRLNKKDDKGIVLLHGVPGTGKTSYIRHLTKEIKEKQIIYIPPDFAVNIANPEFVAFFLDFTNSILIIEDAETILQTRKSGGNQTVSNLLSISDGLLGDGLKLQILCTFNSELSEIDEALLREGRLIAEYKFDKLEIEKSQKIMNKIYEDEVAPTVDKPMSLAEIFNHKDKRFISKKSSNIGFRKNY